jgi:hypothetical protein
VLGRRVDEELRAFVIDGDGDGSAPTVGHAARQVVARIVTTPRRDVHGGPR